jgi:osmotically-inducible protein OsmY
MSLRSVDAVASPAADRAQNNALPAEAERIAASIERAVRSQTNGAIRDLHVEVNREGVVLSGRCSTYYSKQMAQHAAMATPAGGQILNQIDVV